MYRGFKQLAQGKACLLIDKAEIELRNPLDSTVLTTMQFGFLEHNSHFHFLSSPSFSLLSHIYFLWFTLPKIKSLVSDVDGRKESPDHTSNGLRRCLAV
jgi:hypothetical protein